MTMLRAPLLAIFTVAVLLASQVSATFFDFFGNGGSFYGGSSGGGGVYSVNVDQRDQLASDIENVIQSVREADEDGNSFYPYVGGFVRLAFHQCLSGRCVGCINFGDPNNLHLQRHADALEAVRLRHPFIRYGDLWAFAGIVALQFSERLTNARYGRSLTHAKQRLQFRFGRADCPTAPRTTDIYPMPAFSRGLDDITTFFSRRFGFNDFETVALLGAHRLGGFRHPTTGRIQRQWTSAPDLLDNSYFVGLVDSGQGWLQSAQRFDGRSSPAYLWTRSDGRRLMFNTDMCLYKDVRLDGGVEGRSLCTFGSCGLSRTAHYVQQFAASNDSWLSAFMPAYMRATESGYSGQELQAPVVVVVAPPAPKRFCILWFCF